MQIQEQSAASTRPEVDLALADENHTAERLSDNHCGGDRPLRNSRASAVKSGNVSKALEVARVSHEKISAQISRCPWNLENYLSAF